MKTLRHLLLMALLVCPVVGVRAQGELPLKAGDRFALSVSAVPDSDAAQIKGTYTVDDSGMVNLPFIGQVRAVALKPSGLQKAIEQAYIRGEIYERLTVLISVEDAAGPARSLTVTGVLKPGPVPFKAGMTLSLAINTAGGPTPFGSLKKVKLIRAGRQVSMHNLRDHAGDPAVDLLVQPDDQIIVQEN